MTLFSVLARIIWIFVGPMMMLLVLVKSFGRSESGADPKWTFFYFGLVGAVILARIIEQQLGAATTTRGEPSTWRDVRRYVIVFAIVAGACWGGVRLMH